MQAQVETLDGVPEALHDEYEPHGDGFKFKVEGEHPDLASRPVNAT